MSCKPISIYVTEFEKSHFIYRANNEFDKHAHLVMQENFSKNNVLGTMDSDILKLAFDKVSGCKSYPSIQARELNTSI